MPQSLFSKFDDYEVFIEEQHHSRKVDSPSGTALKIKELSRSFLSAGVFDFCDTSREYPGNT